MHREARQLPWWLASIRERAAHCQAVPADRRCCGILTLGHIPLKLADAAWILLEFRPGMPIRLYDRFRCFLEIMKVAQLVRDSRQDLLDG